MYDQKSLFDRNLILIVDDERDFVDATIEALCRKMSDVIFLRAYDGNSALDIYGSNSPMPGVIVLDLMLPGRSGLLILEELKRTSPAKPFPHVIMATANEGEKHQAYAEALGVFEYLHKPFNMEVLVRAVFAARRANH